MVHKTNPLISVALLSAAAGCFLLGTGVTVADVILRKLGGINVRGAIELTSYSIGFGALLSMPVCYALRSHVTAKLLSELMPTLFLRPLGRLGAVASLAFAGLMVWIVGANALSKLGSPETSADLGLSMAGDWRPDARRYLEMGISFVAVGSDLGVFRNATQALRDKFV